MSILLTGAADFVGFYVSRALLARGEPVIGVDNFSDYYAPDLKVARLKTTHGKRGFTFVKVDVGKGIPLFVDWFRTYVGCGGPPSERILDGANAL